MYRSAAGPNGAFAEYAVADAQLLIRIPNDWSFEQGAQLGVATYTTCQCLYQSQTLATPLAPVSTPTDLLVWSGTSAVGQYTVQFAKLAGYRVISTASAKNIDFVKGLGADAVFDYADPETAKKIKEFTGGKLKHAVDCFSEQTSPDQVNEALSDEGGEVSCINGCKSKRENVKVTVSVAYTIFGKVSPGILQRQKSQP